MADIISIHESSHVYFPDHLINVLLNKLMVNLGFCFKITSFCSSSNYFF